MGSIGEKVKEKNWEKCTNFTIALDFDSKNNKRTLLLFDTVYDKNYLHEGLCKA